jgi:DNA-directed RNA polymerase specialized sigma24 family protein
MHFPSAYWPIGRVRGKVVRYWESRRRLEESVASADEPLELAVVRAAVRDLAARYREALLMQIRFGYSIEQLADQLGVAETVVRSRLVGARHQLRAQCGEDTHGDPTT